MIVDSLAEGRHDVGSSRSGDNVSSWGSVGYWSGGIGNWNGGNYWILRADLDDVLVAGGHWDLVRDRGYDWASHRHSWNSRHQAGFRVGRNASQESAEDNNCQFSVHLGVFCGFRYFFASLSDCCTIATG